MERLTDRYDGQAILLCEDEKCKIYGDGMCSAASPCYAEQNAIDKLCAYEDTGLEPEEINVYLPMLKEWSENMGALRHIHELVSAEERGELVRLPCKIGTPCYKIWQFGSARKVIDWVFDYDDIPRWLVDTFLTREEAEAALKEV